MIINNMPKISSIDSLKKEIEITNNIPDSASYLGNVITAIESIKSEDAKKTAGKLIRELMQNEVNNCNRAKNSSLKERANKKLQLYSLAFQHYNSIKTLG